MSASGSHSIWRSKDFLAGCLFTGIGAFFFVSAFGYSLGTVFRMGPGAFPLLIGALMTAVGLGLVAVTLARGSELPSFPAWRPFILITVAVVVFAAGLDRLGLVISTVLLVVVSRLASPPVHLVGTGILAACLTVVAVAIFHYFLRLPIELWP